MLKLIPGLLLAFAGFVASLQASAQILSAAVTGGRVAGVAADGVAAFKGIPFAAPPVGERRWRAPQPVEPWQGVRQADAFAPSCMQGADLVALMGAPPEVSEDCLYLNVWTPARATGEGLPVMVWIYGGGFAGGMTSVPTYDGARLAEKGVVLVSIAYRVGPFGFLAHPELSRESGKGSGNYGLQDQIAGLRWVRANIAAFGGDPQNVTIFGESAGAIAVSMLAASPPAKGLFHKAISESGGSFAPPRAGQEGGQNVPTLAAAEQAGVRFFGQLGVESLAAARALPAERIQGALPPGMVATFWPVADGDVLPGDQYVLYTQGRFNDTPVLIGTNSDEGAMFTPPGVTADAFEQTIRGGYGEHADEILAAYPHATPAEAYESMKDIFRDSAFAWHTWAWAKLQTEHGENAAYVYYFDHRTPASPDGASHAAEIPYVFRNFVGLGAPQPPSEADVGMSALVSDYWVNFARSGDPNGAGLPEWPAFGDGELAMHFDESPSARPVPNLDKLAALDAYYAWRRTQAP